jgi:hypothetical protein
VANVLSLALKINADASGVNLTPVERALKRLGDETDKVTGIFDKFTSGSAAAVQAQDSTRKSLEDLIAARRAGTVSATEFQNQFNAIAEAARTEAAALEQAARITDENRTATERFALKQEELAAQLEAGRISSETYDRAIEKAAATLTDAERAVVGLSNAAREQAALLAEGEKIQQRYGDQQANTQKQLDRLTELYKAGAIDIIAYNNASTDLLGINRQAEESAKARADAEAEAARATTALESEAARIRQQNATAQERFDAAIERANALRQQGFLTEQDYRRELERQAGVLAKAAVATERLGNATEQVANQTLRFNELSGVFSALPGPIGNLAGRISGLSSAGEGLSRIFAGGLSQGVSGLVGSFTALINPVTATLAGVAAFGAAASSVAQGLVQLESRVERLTRLANQLGVSFEFVQTLEEAGRRADVSVQQLSGSFARLQNSLAGADEESKKARAALSGLGVSVAEFGSLTEEQQFELIGERLAAIEDPAKRSAAAIALFGRSGVQLLPFFNELPGAADDIERFGRAITSLEQQEIAAFGAAFDRLLVASQGLGQSLLIAFTEAGTGVAENLVVLISSITRTIEALSGVLRPLVNFLGGALNGALGLVAEGFRAIAIAAEGIRDLFGFIFPSGTASAEQTAEAVNKVRDAVEKPLAANIIREIEQAGRRTTELFRQSTEDVRRYGNEAGIAYIRLRDNIAAAREQFDRTTPEGAERFRRAVEQSNAAYEKQIALIKAANDERLKQIDSERDIVNRLLEQQRIEQQFGGDQARAKAAENFAALGAEIGRLQQELQGAVGSSAEDELRARIDNLRQLRLVESDIASGRRAEQQRQYEEEIERVKAIEAERERLQKETIDRIAQERQRINQFVDEQLALQQFNGDSQRLQAARNLQAIEQEAARVNQEGAAARARNDQAGVDAALRRLAQLDQIAAKEEEIASGRKAAEEELAKRREQAAQFQEKAFAEASKVQQQQAQRAQQAQQAQQAEAQKALEEQAKRNEERLARSRQLATASTEAAQGADIRTEAGARNFIQAIQGGFDPQLAVARQQLKVQREIAVGLQANLQALGFQTFRFPAAAGA